jgi:hypothetical protein
MSADVIKFVCSSVQNWSIRCGGCSFIDIYSGSCQGDVKFKFF